MRYRRPMDERNGGLRGLRTAANWRLRRAERALGLAPGWLSLIERGLRPMPARLIGKMALLYSTPEHPVTADDIVAAVEQPQAPGGADPAAAARAATKETSS